ncbi:MAG: atpC [Rickettsiaceae bacterium]|jgi:F-type H+-transporting ATPase subunit epsilon|nr:atpC [Rickettsiaceae bacterium]
MSKITVELVTPEQLVFAVEADLVEVPGSEGDFGVLHNHAPMISTLRPGVVTVHEDGKSRQVFVSGGFAEVTNELCTIIAEQAVDTSTISDDELKKLIEDAKAA